MWSENGSCTGFCTEYQKRCFGTINTSQSFSTAFLVLDERVRLRKFPASCFFNTHIDRGLCNLFDILLILRHRLDELHESLRHRLYVVGHVVLTLLDTLPACLSFPIPISDHIARAVALIFVAAAQTSLPHLLIGKESPMTPAQVLPFIARTICFARRESRGKDG